MRKCLSLFSALFLSGCVTVSALEDAKAPVAGKPLVFGNVRVLIQNTPYKWSRYFIGGTNFWLLVMAKGAGEARSYRLNDESGFHWALAPGEYRLLGYMLRRYSREYSNRIWATFTVPANAKSVYVGDITIAIHEGGFAVRVADNQVRAAENLRRKFPQLGAAPRKALMRLPERADSLARAESSCGGDWGIRCDDDYLGVRPVRPAMDGTVSSANGGLIPTLEWVASGNARVTYDLTVHEVVRYMYGGLFGPNKMPGPRTIYRENLPGPKFRVPAPLKPGATYYWSVRLRQADRITQWSRRKISTNPIVARGTGNNPWFTFETPAK